MAVRAHARKRLIAAVMAAGIGLALLSVAESPANAAVATFPVMNTSETPPDGVWFRKSPSQNDTKREPGFGVYAGESISVDCYSRGDAVGPYNNHIWYRGLDVSRPTVNGHANYGYMNTHYVNDGMTADHVAPGVPDCDASAPTSTPPATRPLSVYYAPFNRGTLGTRSCASWCGSSLDMTDPAVRPSYRNQWAPQYPQVCNEATKTAAYSQATPSGYYPQTLAGWSLGRLGVDNALLKAAANPTVLSKITYALLIDPGDYNTLSCDRTMKAGDAYANWLLLNSEARLVVISAEQSQENNARGIQESYFNSIRYYARLNNANIRSRVLVCNYSINHYGAYYAGRYWISHRIGATTRSCPWLSSKGVTYKPTSGWHP